MSQVRQPDGALVSHLRKALKRTPRSPEELEGLLNSGTVAERIERHTHKLSTYEGNAWKYWKSQERQARLNECEFAQKLLPLDTVHKAFVLVVHYCRHSQTVESVMNQVWSKLLEGTGPVDTENDLLNRLSTLRDALADLERKKRSFNQLLSKEEDEVADNVKESTAQELIVECRDFLRARTSTAHEECKKLKKIFGDELAEVKFNKAIQSTWHNGPPQHGGRSST